MAWGPKGLTKSSGSLALHAARATHSGSNRRPSGDVAFGFMLVNVGRMSDAGQTSSGPVDNE